MKHGTALQFGGLLAIAFSLAACVGPGEKPTIVSKVELRETYDLRQQAPDKNPADVTGFSVTYTGQRGGNLDMRTLQIPCNVFSQPSGGIAGQAGGFGMTLDTEAQKQAAAIETQVKAGVCAPALK